MVIYNKREKLDIASLIIAVCVFFKLQPWFLWGTSNYLMLGLLPALYLFAIVPNIDLNGRNRLMFWIFFMLFLFLCIIQGYNLVFSLATIAVCAVPFINETKLQKALRYFEIILAVFFAGGLLFYLLVLIGFPLPGRQITALNFEEFSSGYIVYPPFLVRRNMLLEYLRFYGPFDEPGVVGTVSLFVLCIERYNLRKWYVLVIFVAAFFSFSFMFVAGTIVYLAFTYIKKPSKAILVVIALIVFYGLTKDNPVMQQAVYARLEWDAEAGKFAGDNRYAEAQKEYVESIRGTNDYFFGDHGKTEGDFGFSRSYLDAILSYGFIFCFIYVIWFGFYARVRGLSWYTTILFMLIFLLTLYQRPNFTSFSYIFLFSTCVRNWIEGVNPYFDSKAQKNE